MNAESYTQEPGYEWRTQPPQGSYLSLQDVSWYRGGRTTDPLEQQQAQRIEAEIELQMGRFEAEHEAAVSELQRSYVFLDVSAVTAFFRGHRTAPQLLMEALPRLRQNFGVATVLQLRATVDEYGVQTLYAVVLWPGNVRDVVAALDRFDEEWWISNSRQASGDLTFTYELV